MNDLFSSSWAKLYMAGASGTFIFLTFFGKSSDYGTLRADYGYMFAFFGRAIEVMLAAIWPIYWTMIRRIAPAAGS
jgi:hypothetical protein